jgi:hypothetical protein
MRALGASRTSLVPGGVLAGPWVRDDLWRRARAVPSLDLRFADNKSLTDAVTGASLVTFTRASSGTYTDSAGVLQTAATDVPRFDHDPTTGESLGLLVEEQRTNLLLQSNQFRHHLGELGRPTRSRRKIKDTLEPPATSPPPQPGVFRHSTRSADVASITGSAFSGWYRQDEGTVFAEFVPRTFAQACGLLSLDDGTTSERLQTRLSTNGNGAFVVADGGSVQANFSTVASTSLNTKGRLATSFAVNSFKASLNGGSVASDTSGTLPTVAQAVIGNAVGAFIFNGPISRIAFWPREFPESTLQTITQ